MNTEQIMSRPVATCRSSDTLARAAQLMWEHDCGCVPVVNDNGQAVAMITDRDICMAAYTKGRSLSDISVAEAMSRGVFSCKGTDSLDVAHEMMRSKQVRRLPVTNAADGVVGIISLNDIAREADRDRAAGEVAATLNAVGRQRPYELSAAAE